MLVDYASDSDSEQPEGEVLALEKKRRQQEVTETSARRETKRWASLYRRQGTRPSGSFTADMLISDAKHCLQCLLRIWSIQEMIRRCTKADPVPVLSYRVT